RRRFGAFSMHEGQMTFDELAGDDPVVRAIGRALRDGPGMSLEQAANEVLEMGVDPAKVQGATDRIRARIAAVQTAQMPRAVVAGNIESWYPGSRAEDPNWPALVELLREGGWSDDQLETLNDASDKVVAHLPNPHGEGEYHCRGLVLGYV